MSGKARKVSDDDVKAAKQYVLQRVDFSVMAKEQCIILINEAVDALVDIAYRYNIPVSRFAFSAEVNESMMQEVNAVMEDLQESIVELTEDYATACTKDRDRKGMLLALLLTLGHRNMSMSETIHAYLWRTLRQAEALIAAMKNANVSQSQAKDKIKNALQNVNANKEMQQAFKEKDKFTLPYIKSNGQATYPDGQPNVRGVPVDGENAVVNVVSTAISIIWMQNWYEDMKEEPQCIGYNTYRGSNYPCSHVCDPHVGFHSIKDTSGVPPFHPNCQCFIVPVQEEPGTNV